jgi:hypothetical protein
MPLYDPMRRRDLIKDTETQDYEPLARNTVATVSFNKCIRTVDMAIDCLVAEGVTATRRVTWARVASLLGDSTTHLLAADKNHLWKTFMGVYANEKDPDLRKKYINQSMGGMFRWRISLRSELWLTAKHDSTKYDPLTGELITFAVYWIQDNYVPHAHVARPRASISDLANKWGASTR